MNRKLLLESGLTENQNANTVIANTITKDGKFLKKAKYLAGEEVEAAEEVLEERLSSNSPLDKATVEVLYENLLVARSKVALYEKFESEILGE